MNLREIYTISLGKYSDQYLVTGVDNLNNARILRRVRTPKTKIDAVRLPEYISIWYFGQQVPPKKTKKNQKQCIK